MTDLGPLFEIETIDIRGVPTKVFTHAPPSLRAVWEGSAVHADNDYICRVVRRRGARRTHRVARRGYERVQHRAGSSATA